MSAINYVDFLRLLQKAGPHLEEVLDIVRQMGALTGRLFSIINGLSARHTAVVDSTTVDVAEEFAAEQALLATCKPELVVAEGAVDGFAAPRGALLNVVRTIWAVVRDNPELLKLLLALLA